MVCGSPSSFSIKSTAGLSGIGLSSFTTPNRSRREFAEVSCEILRAPQRGSRWKKRHVHQIRTSRCFTTRDNLGKILLEPNAVPVTGHDYHIVYTGAYDRPDPFPVREPKNTRIYQTLLKTAFSNLYCYTWQRKSHSQRLLCRRRHWRG